MTSYSGRSVGTSQLAPSNSATSATSITPRRSIASSSAIIRSTLDLESFSSATVVSAELMTTVGPSFLVASALDIIQVESTISGPVGVVDMLSAPFGSAHIVAVHLSAEYVTSIVVTVGVVVTDIAPSSISVYLDESSRGN